MFISNRFIGEIFIEHECALPLQMNRFEIAKVSETYYIRIGSVGIHWDTPSVFKRVPDMSRMPFFSRW